MYVLSLQDCELITSELTASKVASLLVNNDPLAHNEGYYNMEVKVWCSVTVCVQLVALQGILHKLYITHCKILVPHIHPPPPHTPHTHTA